MFFSSTRRWNSFDKAASTANRVVSPTATQPKATPGESPIWIGSGKWSVAQARLWPLNVHVLGACSSHGGPSTMTMLYSLAPVSAGLRHGAGASFRKAGLVQGARWMSSGRPWQHGLLGRGIQPGLMGKVTARTQAKWFVVSTRSSRDAKGTESESKTGVEAGAERYGSQITPWAWQRPGPGCRC